MFKHHLRTSLRRLRRQKGYAAINVLGLAIGLSVCGVMLLFVRHETSYESFHERADRIHLLHHEAEQEDRLTTTARIPFSATETIRGRIPTVERTARILPMGESRVVKDEGVLYLTDLHYADPEVFDIFTFHLLAGDPATALAEPNSVVIDESLARTLFGADSPDDVLGRTINQRAEWGGEAFEWAYTVTGVMRDVPTNTHWRPRGLVSMSSMADHRRPDWALVPTYVLFGPGAEPEAVDWSVVAELPDFRRGVLADGQVFSRPIRDIHLWGATRERGPEAAAAPPIVRVRIFAAVAFLILLLAAVNYVGMATAMGLGRARATGVQKTMGAGRWQVGSEVLVESVVLASIAAFVAGLLIALLLPQVSHATQVDLGVGPAEVPLLVAAMVALAGAVGLVAGAYPAAVLSRAQPAEAFRSAAPGGMAGAGVRRGLVVFQIGAFVVLIVAAQVMRGQLAFMQEHDLGIQPDQVLVIDALHLPDRTYVLRDLLEQHPAVASTAGGPVPGSGASRFTVPRPDADDDDDRIVVASYFVSPGYLSTLGVQLIAGHADDTRAPRGNLGLVYLNESAVAALGWTPEEAVDRELHGEPVHGVFRDFHHESLHAPVEPMFVNVKADLNHLQVLVRFRAGEARAVLAAAEDAWAAVTSGDPLRAYFLDDHFARLYDGERRMAAIMRLAGLLAVLIAGMGLFALAAYTAERRRREVAIRKVLGAPVGSLVAMLSRDFLVLLGVAFALGAPVAYWLMSRWLENFAYRIDLGAAVFLLTLAAATLVVIAAACYHALRAATADPVKAIRAE